MIMVNDTLLWIQARYVFGYTPYLIFKINTGTKLTADMELVSE